MTRCHLRSLNKRSLDLPSAASSAAPVPLIEHRFVRSRLEGDILKMRLSGDLDVSTASAMRRALRQAECLPVRTVLVDVSRLGFLDATGLGTLVGGYRRLRDQDVRLRLIHASESIRRVVSLIGFEAVLEAA